MLVGNRGGVSLARSAVNPMLLPLFPAKEGYILRPRGIGPHIPSTGHDDKNAALCGTDSLLIKD